MKLNAAFAVHSKCPGASGVKWKQYYWDSSFTVQKRLPGSCAANITEAWAGGLHNCKARKIKKRDIFTLVENVPFLSQYLLSGKEKNIGRI